MLDRTPQVFISYSWTSKEYQELIISIASRMRHDGVDIKLDVWDLKEGQDKYAYMEQLTRTLIKFLFYLIVHTLRKLINVRAV